MRSKFSLLFFALSISVILSGLTLSCRHQNKEPLREKKQSKKSLMEINKTLVKTEDQMIDDYIARYQWDMKTTGTGLRYLIYQDGHGLNIKKGDRVEINYTLHLLNGELIYTSDETGPKSFEIGKGGVESGLEEGILLLNEGDRAKFIIPSHLAFGLLGDMNKIPAKAALVYDIELLKVKQ